jgi:ribulose-phosphate 3-epimerase
MIEIIPSILAADFARLADEVGRVAPAGISMLHVDVMDGHFVPNLTVGPPLVESLRKATKLALDVHLMITNPDQFAPAFIKAGADLVSVHQETCPHLDRTLRMIRSEGARPGVVLNPSTPVFTLEEVLARVDYGLIMRVNPGFGGQKFIPRALDKIRALDRIRRERGLKFAIEIDGGVTTENAAEIVRAGCEWLVAGVTVFRAPDPAARIAEMLRLAREAGAVQV